jgi:glycosyltransferase involved in cell wall biosynthesis
MKLLVFAHTPPPHHGQSYMVKLMLDGLGGDRRLAPPGTPPAEIECYHVNTRYSDTLEDIGSFRLGKMWLVLRYCLEAIWCRFHYGAQVFYYVPAPGKRAALYRDWVVMLLCRPFFHHFIYHWHAVGLGDWLRSEGTWFERWLTHRLLGHGSLGIAVAIPSMRDPLWFLSRHVEIVPNGLPDPCPHFVQAVLPRRQARLLARRRLLAGETLSEAECLAAGGCPEVFRVLYLARCTREKGIFDVLEAAAQANQLLRTKNSPLTIALDVAGEFIDPAEQTEFEQRIAAPDLRGAVTYRGFVSGPAKEALFTESDCFCFASLHESFGLVLVEAMAFGLPVITTSMDVLREMVPDGYPGVVPVQSPASMAQRLVEFIAADPSISLREHFVSHYTETQSVEAMRAALRHWMAAEFT